MKSLLSFNRRYDYTLDRIVPFKITNEPNHNTFFSMEFYVGIKKYQYSLVYDTKKKKYIDEKLERLDIERVTIFSKKDLKNISSDSDRIGTH